MLKTIIVAENTFVFTFFKKLNFINNIEKNKQGKKDNIPQPNLISGA